jgi:hypothetical protein
VQVAGPVDNLAVCVVGLFGAEWGPADKTLEHDGSDRPPIAAIVVTLAAEDFRSNVVGGTNCRVGQLTSRLPPCVDLGTVADGELNLVHVHGVSVVTVGLVRTAGKQLLVVASVVLLVESCRETEVGQLDVTAAIEQDVVGLDVTFGR